MTVTPHRDIRGLIDAHFAGQGSVRQEQRLRTHLPECAPCRLYYERHLLVAAADPQALGAEERLARGLGIGRKAGVAFLPFGAAAMLAAAASVLLWIGPRLGPEREFQARGGGAPEHGAGLVGIFRVSPAGPSEPVTDVIRADDELALTIRNPESKLRLLLFAVDDRGAVFWYAPAWSDAANPPAAMLIGREAGPRELPYATRHQLRPGRLWLHAVLLDEPLGVRDVEAMLATLPNPGGRLPIEATTQEVVVLRVEP